MELIKGNMLIFLSMLSATIFIFLWAKFYDGPFRRVFSFYRKKNMQYEQKQMGILLGSISIICICLYYLFCMILHYKGVPVIYMTFVILLLLSCYLFISESAIKNMSTQLVAVIGLFFLSPFILTICILFYEVQLDRYCGYYSIVLCILDIILIRDVFQYWKEGDF